MPPATPLATYRLQLTKTFGFDETAALVPYLQRLGISHIYASPFLKARPGSSHGYDIVDHDQLNPELGGEQAFLRLSETLNHYDLGLILDFVPNHMGVGHSDNAWWLDVLEWGQQSPYAAAFDIDWDILPHRRHPGVLLPILGRPYGEVLQSGEITLKYDAAAGSFAAWYFDHRLPISSQRYSEMLRTIVTSAGAADKPPGRALMAIADDYSAPDTPSYRQAADLKHRLTEVDGAVAVIKRGLSAYSSQSETGIAALHRLLERQHYRLAYWRVAFSAVNYRRFFDINDLAGLRVENPATFRAVHALIIRLITEKRLQGLRLDHIDGLRDPARYTLRLRQLVHKARRQAKLRGPFYVVVEKILAGGEPMPHFPGVAGTTGYEWLNAISRILVEGKGLDPLERTWRDFTGEHAPFAAVVRAAKRTVIETMLASEFTVLCQALARIAAGHFSTRDYTLDRLRAALQAYVLEFPVYRTYVTAAGASLEDRRLIEEAIARARADWQGPDPEIFDFLLKVITLDLATDAGYSAPRVRNFALKFQQFTGPLTAKAVEDTAFYRYHRLIALNEVGGDPAAPALTLDEFHQRQQQHVQDQPHGLVATSTHDTKRGEDARARILALSELTADWEAGVRDWRNLNAPLIRHSDGRRCPSLGHEYMLYQALIGAWPEHLDDTFVERMLAYAVKAAREGKLETSWTNPNERYEAGLQQFVRNILDPFLSISFIQSFSQLSARTALIGALNGLSQLALKIFLPGVPDFYQGTELWDFSLVDPDNRRPIDFGKRSESLDELPSWTELSARWRDGQIKFALMRKLLQVRRSYADLFRRGSYEPLAAKGPQADHVITFARTWKRQRLVIAIGRNFGPLSEGGRRWSPACAAVIKPSAEATYLDLIGAEEKIRDNDLDLRRLFKILPIAVLRQV